MRAGLWLAAWSAVALIGVAGVVATANSLRFGRQVAKEMRELAAALPAQPRPIDRAHLASLPAPVQRWAEKALGGRDTYLRTARVRHGGSFRPSLDGGWLPIRGEQLFSFDPPGFVWWGRVKIAPGLWIDARDRSVNGAGNMLVKAESTLTLADARGPRLDEGALHRLLAEMAWLVTPLLDPRHVSWTAVDDRSARATLRVNGVEVTATFELGADDLPATVRMLRWRDGAGLTPFVGTSADYRPVDGMLIPHDVRAAWHIDGEAREYVRFVIDSVELEPPR